VDQNQKPEVLVSTGARIFKLAGWEMEEKLNTRKGNVEYRLVTKDTNGSLYMNIARSRR